MHSSRYTQSILKRSQDPNKRKKTVRINSKNQINEVENLKLENALNAQTRAEYKLAKQQVKDAIESIRAIRRLAGEAAAQKARSRLLKNATENHPTNASNAIAIMRSTHMHVPQRNELETHPNHPTRENGIFKFVSGIFGRSRRGGWRVNSKTKTKKRKSLK